MRSPLSPLLSAALTAVSELQKVSEQKLKKKAASGESPFKISLLKLVEAEDGNDNSEETGGILRSLL